LLLKVYHDCFWFPYFLLAPTHDMAGTLVALLELFA